MTSTSSDSMKLLPGRTSPLPARDSRWLKDLLQVKLEQHDPPTLHNVNQIATRKYEPSPISTEHKQPFIVASLYCVLLQTLPLIGSKPSSLLVQ
jgi:hypothetical protein